MRYRQYWGGVPGRRRQAFIGHRVWAIHLALLSIVVWGGCTADSDERLDTDAVSTESAAKPVIERIPAYAEVRMSDPRPSVILIVVDTLRADAVSSYGAVEGTTPTLDRVGQEGIRYTRAFAPAPWTVSSHTSLFTGLRVDEHGVGLGGASVAPAGLQMLAEDFGDAGYITAGFSENMLVSSHFGLSQGFDTFAATDIVKIMRHLNVDESPPKPFDVVGRVRDWDAQRDKSLPYFLFVNIFEPHDPYAVRKENRWVRSEKPISEIEYIASRYPIPESICDGLPDADALDVLHGLYLGDVSGADVKVNRILEMLEPRAGVSPPLTIITADHGEHFGENRLMGHQFSVRNAVLHIPMLVTGLPEIEPAVVDQPVELRQIRQSLHCWALDASCPADLPLGKAVEPTASETTTPIFSVYSDSITRFPTELVDQFGVPEDGGGRDPSRLRCKDEDPVFGTMVSMIRYPWKAIWFDQHPPLLYDLSWDPQEQSNQMSVQPDRAMALFEELDTFVAEKVVDRDVPSVPGLSEEGYRALKSLGYIE